MKTGVSPPSMETIYNVLVRFSTVGRMVRFVPLALVFSLLTLSAIFLPSAYGYKMRYDWKYDGSWYLNFEIQDEWYRLYKSVSMDKRGSAPLAYFTTTNDPGLKNLANTLRDWATKRNYGSYDEASFVLAFVQSLPYTSDSVSSGFDEYPRFPIETLVDQGGDCEDTSILYATLMKILGYGVVYFTLPGHAAVGVLAENVPGTYVEYNGGKYYYAETTGENWRIGDLPSEFNGKPVGILSTDGEAYDPTKSVSFQWKASWSREVPEDTPFEISFEIKNSGDIPVTISKVLVYSDLISTPVESEFPSVQQTCQWGRKHIWKSAFCYSHRLCWNPLF